MTGPVMHRSRICTPHCPHPLPDGSESEGLLVKKSLEVGGDPEIRTFIGEMGRSSDRVGLRGKSSPATASGIMKS